MATPEQYPLVVRREVERACDEAEHHNGMTVGMPVVRLPSDKVRYMVSVIDKLATERDALALDARRYRFLREEDVFSIRYTSSDKWLDNPSELDAAIDAALDK